MPESTIYIIFALNCTFLVQTVISEQFYGPPVFSPEYCPEKHKTQKIKIILGHENLKLSCPCKKLIPKWSIYPKSALNIFFHQLLGSEF